MVHDVLNDGFLEVIDPEAAPEKIGGGFDFTEGPVWHPREKTVVFSDMPGNHMRVWTEAGGVATFRKPSNMANGNAYDLEGRLVTCEHATSRVTRTGHDGGIEVLASHYEGKELNSPNDIIVASDGAIIFTDPGFGRMAYYGVERESELGFRGVYRLEAGRRRSHACSPRISTSRTASASRSTRSASGSTTPCAAISGCSMWKPAARSPPAASGRRLRAKARACPTA